VNPFASGKRHWTGTQCRKEATMRGVLVQYKVKPGREAENRGLIEEVFKELAEAQPDKLRYAVLELEDGTFIHYAVVPQDQDANPLGKIAAFQRFQSGASERRLEQPVVRGAKIVGNYKTLVG
jgi:hypothetical protein